MNEIIPQIIATCKCGRSGFRCVSSAQIAYGLDRNSPAIQLACSFQHYCGQAKTTYTRQKD